MVANAVTALVDVSVVAAVVVVAVVSQASGRIPLDRLFSFPFLRGRARSFPFTSAISSSSALFPLFLSAIAAATRRRRCLRFLHDVMQLVDFGNAAAYSIFG